MAYSYTKITTHDKCPAKYKYKYIERVPVPERPASPAATRGLTIHQAIEAFLKRETEEILPELSYYGQFLMSLREFPGLHIERGFGINDDYEIVPYTEATVFRGFLDVHVDAEGDHQIFEWKTGKIYPEHALQRMLYAIAALQLTNHDSVVATSVYLDLKQNQPTTFYREMLDEYKEVLKRKINDIENDQQFIAKPSYLCRYCDYSRHNGGPCPF